MKIEAEELQREAIALWKQYGFFMKPALPFLRRLADFLEWQDFKGQIK